MSRMFPLSTGLCRAYIHSARCLRTAPTVARNLSVSLSTRGLAEFFDSDDKWTWNTAKLNTGRAWLSAELRLKSFENMHQLWYICLKEKNKLYSQKEEARRFRLNFPNGDRLAQVELTMARIKQVLWERKLAFEEAQSLIAAERVDGVEEGADANASGAASAGGSMEGQFGRAPEPGPAGSNGHKDGGPV